MSLPDVHDPTYWLQELRPLLDELHFAFQAALPRALEYFDVYRKRPINGPVLSNLIRYEVIEYLRAHGISAHAEEEEAVGPLDGCDMNPLPNNGIELIYRGSCVRLRKGIEPPMPTTDAQREWYQQNLFDDLPTITNLLVLWYSNGHRQFAGLKLLRTKRVLRNSVACDWEVNVDAPIILTRTVESEYSKDPELPLNQNEQQQDNNEKKDKTGTDNDAN